MGVRIALIIIFIILEASSSAQAPHTFARYSKENGLTSSTIQDMTQDDKGFIWLASWGGLYKFDGTSFTNHKTSSLDAQGKPRSNRFIKVEYDDYGFTWALAYDNVLYRIGEAADTLSPVGGDKRIERMIKLSDKALALVSTDNEILIARFSKDGREAMIPYHHFGKDAVIYDIKEDKSGHIWIMSGEGLYCNSDKVDKQVAFCAETIGDAIYFGSRGGRILKYTDGKLSSFQSSLKSDIRLIAGIPGSEEALIGSAENGIAAYNLQSGRHIEVPLASYVNGNLACLKDAKGNLWVYSTMGGLDWYDTSSRKLVPFYNKNIQEGWNSENRIAAIMSDRQGDLWISSYWGGLEEVIFNDDDFKFKAFGRTGQISPENSVRALYQENNGNITAATKDGGVHVLDKRLESIRSWKTSQPVYCISQSRDGSVWLGTKGAGLLEVHKRQGQEGERQVINYRKSDTYYGPDCDQIYSLAEDNSGRLWIGAFDDGISYVDIGNDTRIFVNAKNRMKTLSGKSRIRRIVFGPDGELYAGGQAGLFVCNNPDAEPEDIRFTQFSKSSNYDIQDILITSEGTIYAASYGNGFLQFDMDDPSSGFTAYTTESGLLSNFVLSAVEDKSGNIWLTSEGGLNRFNPQTESIISYSFDRLGYKMRFNEGAALHAGDGNIYFNTNAGIFFFNPGHISNSDYVPELLITSCSLSGHPVDALQVVKMGQGDRLDIGYVAIDMTAPERVLYSYKIDDKDGEWKSLGNAKSLSLSGLSSGRHTLRLRSTNADGIQIDNEKDIMLSVRPPFYASLWSILVYIAIALALCSLYILNRRSKKAEEASGENPLLEKLQGNDRQFAADLIRHIDDNLDNGALNVDNMAKALNISRSALYKRCVALLDKTPTELMHDIRLAKAAELIKSGGYQISQIAFMTGFNDPHYFSKAFKKEFGISPSQYKDYQ